MQDSQQIISWLQILHKVGAERAAAAVIALDTPGANYRTVWALSKHFPHVKTFVRAHDVDHGMTLEKAGATAVCFLPSEKCFNSCGPHFVACIFTNESAINTLI